MKNIKTPKLTLVGAGPGDAELITVKGLLAIQQADVILYDALVNPELLEFASVNSKLIFVGKRKGLKAYEQEEINQLIVNHALSSGHVVRLKGGDSFVFGRGYEEILFAGSFGIATEIIPGISSSISVPALAGIPVTHRGLSNSFWVLTATQADGSLNKEIINAANSSATVVILMGLSKLNEITEIYIKSGKGNENIAVISNGSLPTQKTAIGNISNIIQKVKQGDIKSPAVIVIGEVVKLKDEFQKELIGLSKL